MIEGNGIKPAMIAGLFCFSLAGCFHAPYNNFDNDHRALRQVAIGAGIGAGAGAGIGAIAGNTAVGAALGGLAGATAGMYYNTKHALLTEIQNQDMQFTQYGDTMTLVVPTDRYFVFNTPHLNDICYPGLNNIVRLLKQYPNSPIYVAGFTDDVGSRYHKKMLSQARAEAILTFLWANDIHAQRLHAEGYSDQHTLGDNHWIHGSAYNRRIEIQWLNIPEAPPRQRPFVSALS
jgi:outer membrane protein OmpA-like peptidoglycan-associated protein